MNSMHGSSGGELPEAHPRGLRAAEGQAASIEDATVMAEGDAIRRRREDARREVSLNGRTPAVRDFERNSARLNLLRGLGATISIEKNSKGVDTVSCVVKGVTRGASEAVGRSLEQAVRDGIVNRASIEGDLGLGDKDFDFGNTAGKNGEPRPEEDDRPGDRLLTDTYVCNSRHRSACIGIKNQNRIGDAVFPHELAVTLNDGNELCLSGSVYWERAISQTQNKCWRMTMHCDPDWDEGPYGLLNAEFKYVLDDPSGSPWYLNKREFLDDYGEANSEEYSIVCGHGDGVPNTSGDCTDFGFFAGGPFSGWNC